MKYLKNFETTAEYNAFKLTENFVTPNVSLCEDAPTVVHYEPYVAPIVQQHDYVEIGGIKWATMNLGANSVTGTGLYYQWGDTQGYTATQIGNETADIDQYRSNYKYNGPTKYNDEDGLITLQASDDAVAAAWGGNWRMPTEDEWTMLEESVDTEWTSNYQNSNVAGLICTDKEDSSKVLFFPSIGWIGEDNETGRYWTSTLMQDYGANCAISGFVGDFGITHNGAGVERYNGCQIRGIYDDSNS
jgi:hypothetical protein